MDSKLDKVLHDLRILSKIPRNGRIRKSDMGRVTIEENNYLVSLRRYYNQDSRKQAMRDIAAIFNDAFAEVNNILNSRYFNSSTLQTTPYHGAPTSHQQQQPLNIPIMNPANNPIAIPLPSRANTRVSSPVLDPSAHFLHNVPQPPHIQVPTHVEDERRRTMNTLAILCRDLTAAIEGVQMLKLTYSQDVAMITALDRLIEKVILCITDIRQKVPVEVLQEYCPEPPKHDISDSY